MAVSTIKGATMRTVSASDVITLESGFSIENNTVDIVEVGNIMQMRFVIVFSNPLTPGAAINIGTLKSEYRPRKMSFIGGAYYVGIIGDDGRAYLNPITAMSASRRDNIAAFYIR